MNENKKGYSSLNLSDLISPTAGCGNNDVIANYLKTGLLNGWKEKRWY